MPRRQFRKPCKVTGKVAYRDRDAAETFAPRIVAHRTEYHKRLGIPQGLSQPLYAYRCGFCGAWHLTHLKPREGTS